MSTTEIVLPITEPETEWVRGRAVRKVSPTRDHSRLQTELSSAMNVWSRGRGEVGTEWRFRIEPPGEPRRPLVPDISYVKVERRIIRVHDASGETVLTVADTLRHAALREFALPLGPLFSRALDLPR